jgi:hypothetical protein
MKLDNKKIFVGLLFLFIVMLLAWFYLSNESRTKTFIFGDPPVSITYYCHGRCGKSAEIINNPGGWAEVSAELPTDTTKMIVDIDQFSEQAVDEWNRMLTRMQDQDVDRGDSLPVDLPLEMMGEFIENYPSSPFGAELSQFRITEIGGALALVRSVRYRGYYKSGWEYYIYLGADEWLVIRGQVIPEEVNPKGSLTTDSSVNPAAWYIKEIKI